MKKESFFQAIIFILVIAFCILIFIFREEIKKLEKYGYLGAFLISLFSNATLIIPVPGLAIIMSLATIFNPWLIGFLASLGATFGQTTGYLLGYSGRLIIKESTKYQKMVNWMQRWGALIIFLLALIPNPFFDVVGAIAGILRFHFLKFFLFCFLGNAPKYLFFSIISNFGFKLFF